ncbi:hypothetical protein [Streptomyces sp. NBC_01236]|uniref:hypothetical protein n=1 Tax=Streptomyces sp. NBC_01236 TaxID=2903789 RepID=UPI002E110E6F|nr:hypothetical protein OG324_50270 [Streptomyces sp. NBC_01236]
MRMTAELVHAAGCPEDPIKVAEALEERLQGPVIYDHRRNGATYYALIPWHAGLVWAHSDTAPCLGPDVYLGIPRLDRQEGPRTYRVVAHAPRRRPVPPQRRSHGGPDRKPAAYVGAAVTVRESPQGVPLVARMLITDEQHRVLLVHTIKSKPR